MAQLTEQPDLEAQVKGALEILGTRRKAVTPSTLEEFAEQFSQCPRVSRRLRPKATHSEIASVTSQVLREIIDELPSPRDRLLAKAILAIDKFQGMSVKQRKSRLNKTPEIGSTPDSYKHRRQEILTAVVVAFFRDRPAPQAPPWQEQPEPELSESESWMHRVGFLASELYFRGITSLFLPYIETLIDEQRDATPQRYLSVRYPGSPSTVWEDASERFFLSFAQFSAYFHLALGGEIEASSGSLRGDGLEEAFDQHVSPPALQSIRQLVDAVRLASPRMNEEQEEAVRQYGATRFGYPWNSAWDVMHDIWHPWFFHNLENRESANGSDQRKPPDIERLTAAAHALDKVIQGCCPYKTAMVASSRRNAHKFVSYSFDFDEWLPLIKDVSLRDHLDRFLDSKSIELDKLAGDVFH